MPSKVSILQAAADYRARQAVEAQRRAEQAKAKAWRAANREAVKQAIERNKREAAYYKDVAAVRRYEGRQKALDNVLRKLAQGSSPAREAQRIFIRDLRAAIERDALAVAEAMARMMEYEKQAEAEKQAEYLRYHGAPPGFPQPD